MKKFTQEDLFRFFRGKFSEEETTELNAWLKEDERNREAYRKSHNLFDAMLMGRIGEDASDGAEKGGRRIFRIAAAVIANVAAIIGVFFIARHTVTEELDDRLAKSLTTIEAPAGQRLDITLEDGTKVTLNSGAALTYPSIFRMSSRDVSLKGEAFFDVRHDERRPFTVHTYASDVRVLGTRFTVSADEELNQFTAILVDGSIKVTSTADSGEYMMMKPSDMVSLENGHLVYKGKYSYSDVSWTEGIVVLDGLDFDRLVRKLEKAYGVSIIMDRDITPSMESVTGELRIADGIDHAMKVLQHIAAIDYSTDPHTGEIHIR